MNTVNLNHCARFVFSLSRYRLNRLGLQIEPQERPPGHSRAQSVKKFLLARAWFLMFLVRRRTRLRSLRRIFVSASGSRWICETRQQGHFGQRSVVALTLVRVLWQG